MQLDHNRVLTRHLGVIGVNQTTLYRVLIVASFYLFTKEL